MYRHLAAAAIVFGSLLVGPPLGRVVVAALFDMHCRLKNPEEMLPDFDPRRWIETHLSKEAQTDIAQATYSGQFDLVPGPKQLPCLVENALVRARTRQKLDQAAKPHPIAFFLGGLIGGALDPFTYLLAVPLIALLRVKTGWLRAAPVPRS